MPVQRRDDNRQIIASNEAYFTIKTVAFADAAGQGAVGTVALFTITGDVLANIFATCSEDLAGATATIAVGIAGNTAAFIAQTTATDIDSGEVWIDNAPATVEAIPAMKIVAAGADIIATVATAAISDGTLAFYCQWSPLSSGASVVAA